jgi:hypothetical protein
MKPCRSLSPPFMTSLPNPQRLLSPFVLSLSKYERTRQRSSKCLLGHRDSLLINSAFPIFPIRTLQIVFQSLPFDTLPSTGSGQAGRTD